MTAPDELKAAIERLRCFGRGHVHERDIEIVLAALERETARSNAECEAGGAFYSEAYVLAREAERDAATARAEKAEAALAEETEPVWEVVVCCGIVAMNQTRSIAQHILDSRHHGEGRIQRVLAAEHDTKEDCDETT